MSVQAGMRRWGLLIIALAVVMAHVHILFAGQTPVGRHLDEWLPALDHLGRSIAGGRLPEWFDGIGLGVPFAADSTNLALYPPAWLVALVPAPVAADLLLIVHAMIAGAGAAMLARRMAAGDIGAFTAGAAFATGGAITSLFGDGGTLVAVAWTPWIAWAGIGIAQARGWAATTRAGAMLAALAALQLHAGGIEAIAPSALLAAGVAATRARTPAPLLPVALALLVGLLLAGAVVLPELLLSAPDPGGTASWSALPRMLAPLGEGPYLGAPLILLAAIGVWRRRHYDLAALAAGLVLLAPLAGRLHLISAALMLCVLAAHGLNAVCQEGMSRRAAVTSGAAALVHAAVMVGIAIGLDAAPERSIGAAFVMALLAAAIFISSLEGRERYAIAALAAVVVGHTVADTWAALPRVDRASIASRPALLPAPRGSRDRIYRPRSLPARRGTDTGSPPYRHQSLAPNTAARFGYAHLRGHGRARSPEIDRAWSASATASERLLDLYGVHLALVPASVVVRANLPIVARSADGVLALVENERRRPRAFVAPRWRRLASPEAVLEALFPPAGRPPLRLGTVHLSGDGDGGSGGPSGPAPAPPCAVESPRPESVRLDCPASKGGYAVVLDSFAPGWSATVDGEAAEIERVDLLVRGVKVGPGAHTVVFRYRTPGLRLGALIALLAWLNLGVLLVILWPAARVGDSVNE